MRVTPALGGVLALAYMHRSDRRFLTYPDLFLGLLLVEDEHTSLFRTWLTETGAQIESIMASHTKGPGRGRIATDQAGLPSLRPTEPMVCSISVGEVLSHIAKLVHEKTATIVHLIRVLLSNAGHQNERQSFRIGSYDAWEAWVGRQQRFRPDFSPDTYTGGDLLDITNDVRALAQLIVDRQMAPPLAVGLFGAWGSGKSFFMSHLKARISELTNGARSRKDRKHCFQHVVQIEFNTWHYVDSNLWSSLTQHLFEELARGSDGVGDDIKRNRRELGEKLAAQSAALVSHEASVKELESRISVNEQRLDMLKREKGLAEEEARNLQPAALRRLAAKSITGEVRQRLSGFLRRSGIHDVAVAAHDAELEIVIARQQIRSLGSRLNLLWSSRYRWHYLLAIFAALAIPAGVTYSVAATEQLKGDDFLLKVSGGIMSLMAGALAGWRSLSATLQKAIAEIDLLQEAVQKDIAAKIAEQTKDTDEKIVQNNHILGVLQKQLATAAETRDALRRQMEITQIAIDGSSASVQLRTFVTERMSGDSYKKNLGMISMLRNDYGRLTKLILHENENPSHAEAEPKALLINRIVLYIDDLDRCPEDRVVEVLQAVHLLLAFPIFVVVVGVDPAWMARCLKKIYPAHFLEGNPSEMTTPEAWLEKIFQIPIWLKALTHGQRGSMVKSLMATRTLDAMDDAAPTTGTSDERLTKKDPSTADPSSRIRPAGADAVVASETTPERPSAQPYAAIELTCDEQQFAEKIAMLLPSSPRVIKRFVNTYRLLKASFPPWWRDGQHQTRSFIESSPTAPYRTCLLTLALAIAHPKALAYLISHGDGGDSALSGLRSLREIPEWSSTHEEIAPAIAEMTSVLAAIPMSDVVFWSKHATRFTFFHLATKEK